jgi:hypothetical protein
MNRAIRAPSVSRPGPDGAASLSRGRKASNGVSRFGTGLSAGEGPEDRLTDEELDVVTAGFMRIRDQEPLDDVADWANAVLALLEDEAARSHRG